MTRAIFTAVVLATVAFGIGAQAPGDGAKRPKSSAVKRALVKRDRSVEQAEAAYRKAAADANEQLLGELKKAKDAALLSKDLEANAVAAVIAETEQASGGAGVPPNLDGRWEVVFGSGDRRSYDFKGAGYSMKQGDFSVAGTLRKTKAGLVHDEGNGKLNRITVVGDRFFIEHFVNPQADFPSGRPNNVGVGLPVR